MLCKDTEKYQEWSIIFKAKTTRKPSREYHHHPKGRDQSPSVEQVNFMMVKMKNFSKAAKSNKEIVLVSVNDVLLLLRPQRE